MFIGMLGMFVLWLIVPAAVIWLAVDHTNGTRPAAVQQDQAISPTRAWLGFIVLAIVVAAVLQLTHVVGANRTIGEWWPLAVIGFGIVRMVSDRRIGGRDVVLASVGVALLLDEWSWVSADVIWPAFLVWTIGVTLIWPRRSEFARAVGSTFRGPDPS